MKDIEKTNFIITIESINGELCISQECTSGCYYKVKNKNDILKALKNYLDNYLVEENEEEE